MSADVLARLDQHQQAILSIVGQGEAMMTEGVGDVAEIARARWALVRALTAYQLFKHREIFDPAIAAGGIGAAQGRRMKAACTVLGDAFRDHVQRWSATDVQGQWSAYRPAALAIAARIRSHMARERAEAAVLLGE